jgi:hypothetical protein
MKKLNEVIAEYPTTDEVKAVKILDKIHDQMNSDPEMGAVISRAYCVVSVTSFENGVAAGLALMGDKGIALTGDITKDADVIQAAGIDTIAVQMLGKQLADNGQLEEMCETAQGVVQGAQLYAKDAKAELEA